VNDARWLEIPKKRLLEELNIVMDLSCWAGRADDACKVLSPKGILIFISVQNEEFHHFTIRPSLSINKTVLRRYDFLVRFCGGSSNRTKKSPY